MQLVLKIFTLLINLDQETVLTFFGIEDPNNYSDPSYNIPLQITQVSTSLSFETLKILFQGLLERFQGGLGLVDIENIILFIIFFRFIILALRYNIKTSFYISCIGLFAAGLWYTHIKDLLVYYRDVMFWNRFTSQLGEDTRTLEILDQTNKHYAVIGENKGVLPFIKSVLVEGGKRGEYRMDPIAMLFTKMPESIKAQTDKLYWSFFGSVLPTAWKFFIYQILEYLPLITYLVVVRLNKRFCPYFIRWHWTFLMVFSMAEGMVIRLVQRLHIYWATVLLAEGRYSEGELVFGLIISIVILHFLFILFGLLHAACGQYFYFPFLVENAEIHIGPRPQNSIYSGGYTAWQNSQQNQLNVNRNLRSYFPKLWWGWLGKGNTTMNFPGSKEKLARQTWEKRKNFFQKIIKQVRRWVFNK